MPSKLLFAALCSAAIVLAGCQAGSIRKREAGALGGGALGAGLGAIVGNQVGNTGAGIAIGGAFGALSGALIGNEMDNQDVRANQNAERLAAGDRDLAENRKLIEELRARGTDARMTDRGVVVNLPDVLFAFNSAQLAPEARGSVSEISNALRDAPGRRVSIEGHTDSVGSQDYNLRLSRDRADSVARELVRAGTSRQNISTHGYGKSRPIASNNTERGRARNRRVEVVIENS